MTDTSSRTTTYSFTGWLHAAQSPCRSGFYWRQWPAGPFSCWRKGTWYGDASSPDAAGHQTEPSPYQQVAWRGLERPADSPTMCTTCRGKGVLDRGFDFDREVDAIEPCPDC